MNKELELAMNEVLSNELADRHSLFQLQYFVIGKEPTIQSKLWRCVKELQARQDSIESLNLEIEESSDKIMLLNLDIEHEVSLNKGDLEFNGFEDPKRKINIRRLERQKKSLNKTVQTLNKKIKYVEEESQFFVSAYKSLSEVETMKPYDDEKSQIEYWNEKLSQEMGLRGLIKQPLDIDLIKTILSLDDRAPVKKKTAEMLERTQKQIIENQLLQKKAL